MASSRVYRFQMEFIFRAIMFSCERKENYEIKIGSNSQFLPIGSRFVSRYSHSRHASTSPAFRSSLVFEERQIKSVKKQQSKWLDIIWHCRLAIRIILSLALIGTVSHINVLSDMQIELFLCAMQRGWYTPPRASRTCVRRRERLRVFAKSRDIAPLFSPCALWGPTNRAIINVTNYTLDTLPEESSPNHSTIALAFT